MITVRNFITALRMTAARLPKNTSGPDALRELARELQDSEEFMPTAEMVAENDALFREPVVVPEPVVMPIILPLQTAPRDGTYMLLFGPSGYNGVTIRCEISCWLASRAHPENETLGWRTHSGDAFTDGGGPPVGWLPLPMIPVDIAKKLFK